MEIGAIERARDLIKCGYFHDRKAGQECVEELVAQLQKSETALREENDKLKRLCRYQYMTLGYYGTHYNYDSKNIAYHPISGQAASGIMADGGHDARQAQFIARDLGFDGDEICSWSGPGVKALYGDELEAAYKEWFQNRTGKKLETKNKEISGSPGIPLVGAVDAPTPQPNGSV